MPASSFLKRFFSVLLCLLLFCAAALPVPSFAADTGSVLTFVQRHHGSFDLPASLTEEEAASFLRRMSSDKVAQIVSMTPKKQRIAVLFQLSVLRGRMDAAEAAEAEKLLHSLPNKKYAVLYLARHEEQVKELLDDVAAGKQVFMGSMIYNAHVQNYSALLLRHMNLAPVIKKIRDNTLAPESNQGWKIFNNYEELLPPQKRGYYREVRVPTPGVKGAGPQRLVYGRGGEIYYTPDHYATFYRLEAEL